MSVLHVYNNSSSSSSSDEEPTVVENESVGPGSSILYLTASNAGVLGTTSTRSNASTRALAPSESLGKFDTICLKDLQKHMSEEDDDDL